MPGISLEIEDEGLSRGHPDTVDIIVIFALPHRTFELNAILRALETFLLECKTNVC